MVLALNVPDDDSKLCYHISLDIPAQGTALPIMKQPQIVVHVLPSKYDKPIPVIAFFDTEATMSMMTPDIVPEELWEYEKHLFYTADGKIFDTKLITKQSIVVQILLDCIVQTKIIGSDLTSKDILVGFDL